MADFVDALRALTVTPHITVDGHATKTGKRRKTRIDRRTTRHAGYAVSQRLRKRIEESFGWIKTTGGLAKTREMGPHHALSKITGIGLGHPCWPPSLVASLNHIP